MPAARDEKISVRYVKAAKSWKYIDPEQKGIFKNI